MRSGCRTVVDLELNADKSGWARIKADKAIDLLIVRGETGPTRRNHFNSLYPLLSAPIRSYPR
jgi:hypothetical protein